MYSICVKVPKKGYILVSIKQDGIDESSRVMKVHTEQVNALLDFGKRVASIIKATRGKKENEVL